MATLLNVRLSAAGQKAANGQPLSIHTGQYTATFAGAEPQQVDQADWETSLRSTTNAAGDPLFEISPDVPATRKLDAPPASTNQSTQEKE